MSMENAILKHAEALLALSEALNAMNAGRAGALALPFAVGGLSNAADEKAGIDASTKAAEADRTVVDLRTDVKSDAKLEKAVSKVEDDATMTRSIPREEIEKAITEAKEEAKTLSYADDVKPVLLQLAKKQRQLLVDLLAKYNAKNGEAIQVKDFAAVIAEAQAQLAA